MCSRPHAATALSPVLTALLLAACDGEGAPGDLPPLGAASPVASIEDDAGTALSLSAVLDGLTVRRIGLVRFDVFAHTVPDGGERPGTALDATGKAMDDEDIGRYPTPTAYTEGRASFVALDAPLDADALARVAALGRPGSGCFAVGEASFRSAEAYVRAAGKAVYAGEVLTVSRPSGSWFELHAANEAVAGYRHVEMRTEPEGRGVGGALGDGTVLDVPGGAFPAFAAVAVPPMEALTGVGRSAVDLTWEAGADASVPLVVDITFSGFVTPKQSAGRNGAAKGPLRIPYPAGELPGAIRCVTPDDGRFVMPEAVRDTIREARALSVGSATVTEQVTISRLVTRYHVAEDALLIVQSGNGGASRGAARAVPASRAAARANRPGKARDER